MPSSRKITLFSLLAILLLISLYLFFDLGSKDVLGALSAFVEEFSEKAAKMSPLYFTLSLVILPAVGFPMSLLCIAAGGVYGLTTTLVYGSVGLLLNIALSYFLAAYVIRKPIHKLLQCFSFNYPPSTRFHRMRFILLIRVFPGVPLWAQNYILGLLKVPFRKYMLISFPIQIGWLLGYAALGKSIFDYRIEYFCLGIAVLIGLSFVFKWVRERLRRRRSLKQS